MGTENGYALCDRHMAAWRAGGWNGRSEPYSRHYYSEHVDLCADCTDEEGGETC